MCQPATSSGRQRLGMHADASLTASTGAGGTAAGVLQVTICSSTGAIFSEPQGGGRGRYGQACTEGDDRKRRTVGVENDEFWAKVAEDLAENARRFGVDEWDRRGLRPAEGVVLLRLLQRGGRAHDHLHRLSSSARSSHENCSIITSHAGQGVACGCGRVAGTFLPRPDIPTVFAPGTHRPVQTSDRQNHLCIRHQRMLKEGSWPAAARCSCWDRLRICNEKMLELNVKVDRGSLYLNVNA